MSEPIKLKPGQRLRLWQALVTLVVTLIVLVALQYGIANKKASEAQRKAQQALEQSEQKWCAVLDVFLGLYAANPPAPGTNGDILRINFTELKKEFGCA